MPGFASKLYVRTLSPRSRIARLHLGERVFFCLVGRSGLSTSKREGDGATPCGSFRLVKLLERRDRNWTISTGLPKAPIRLGDAWCDDPRDRNYNRQIRRQKQSTEETLTRSDSAYDALVVLDYNLHPRKRGAGSAIFFHLIREGATFTQGCVAVSARDMRRILASCGPKTKIEI